MYFVLNCNVLALLSFYALPSGGNQKTWWSIKRLSMLGSPYLDPDLTAGITFINYDACLLYSKHHS